MSKFNAGDLVTIKITVDDACHFNGQRAAYLSPSQIVKHEPAPFDFTKDLKPGMAFRVNRDGWGYGNRIYFCFKAKDGTPLWGVENIAHPQNLDYMISELVRDPNFDIETQP